MKLTTALVAATALCAVAAPAYAVNTTQSTNATAMANALAGTGFHLQSASLTSDTQNGFFSNGLAGTGISQGVVLTTGNLACAGGTSNTTDSCGGAVGASPGTTAALKLTFTLDSSELFFNYVFASEEYNEFVNLGFNDGFSLVLNGTNYSNVNLATLPGGGGAVSIDNVNSTHNSAYYRNNRPGPYPVEMDGLTTVLTASANNLVVGDVYTLTFSVFDVGDDRYDSAVYLQQGTIGTVVTPPDAVPEPATWAMMISGFGLVGGAMRRRSVGRLATA